MKLGISNLAWEINLNSKVYCLMKQYGFTGLEIAPTKLFGPSPYITTIEDINNFKNSIESNNLKIIAMQSILYGKNNIQVFDSSSSLALKDYLEASIKFSKEIGCPIIVFGSPKNRSYKDKSSYLDTAYTFFNLIGNYANKNDVKFCIEVNPKEYGTNFINTFKEQLEFLNNTTESGLGLHVDLGSMILNNESFNLLEKYTGNINHIHLSLPFLKEINKSSISAFSNLKEVLKNYNNYVSIEMIPEKSNNQLDKIEESLNSVAKLLL